MKPKEEKDGAIEPVPTAVAVEDFETTHNSAPQPGAAEPSSLAEKRVASGSRDGIVALMREEFDQEFYLARYNDVSMANAEPFEHYLNFGWKEDRDPRPGFDSEYYRKRHLALSASAMSSLEHYVRIGRDMGLPLSEQEELQRFGNRNWSDLIQEFLAMSGVTIRENSGDVFHRFILPMFCPETFRRRRGIGEKASYNELLSQYLVFEFVEGGSPGPLFDHAHYLKRLAQEQLPPVREEGGSFLHWLEHGVPQKIVPNALFSDDEYVERNPDVKRDYSGWPFEHFLQYGLKRDRPFSPLFFMPPKGDLLTSEFSQSRSSQFLAWIETHPEMRKMLAGYDRFLSSGRLMELTTAAAKHDPLIGRSLGKDFRLLPPWQDEDYLNYKAIRDLVPNRDVSRIILMPFCKMGGADYLTGVLAKSAGNPSETLILRTEQADWARPDWFPEEAESVDLSRHLTALNASQRARVLYELIRSLEPKHVYNCNSETGFETFLKFGARLRTFTRIYSYFYCSDYTVEGAEVGYPVKYFADLMPHLNSALFDSNFWLDKLSERFAVPPRLKARMHAIYVPPPDDRPNAPVVDNQVATAAARTRPLLLWAGRLDRQKRFDLLAAIARQLPEIDFRCWGRHVLDANEFELDTLPENVSLNPPFDRLDELPLEDSDGWLYTSAWDGLPNILIAVGAHGIPIVASGVGAVPELIDDSTGWPVRDVDDPDAYVVAIRDMLRDNNTRKARAHALFERVRARHTVASFRDGILAVESAT